MSERILLSGFELVQAPYCSLAACGRKSGGTDEALVYYRWTRWPGSSSLVLDRKGYRIAVSCASWNGDRFWERASPC